MKLIEQNYSEIEEIFFHEFGHYLAFKLSFKNIPDFAVEHILIERCLLCKNGFGGETKPVIPKSHKNSRRLNSEELSHVFTRSYFGVIFQLLFTCSRTHLEVCMSDFGQLDNMRINDFLKEYKLNFKHNSINQHFINLLSKLQESISNIFTHEQIVSLTEEKEGKIYINLELLEKYSKDFINGFEPEYNKNIKILTKIIDDKK